ncbi:MAG: hypothetical protein DVB31_16670 [Verrucomicrobia bacterium]|nr:MAG: hypothetical protein DVB31_16670 [Verrucomicrobiota bacterium]
MTSAAAFLGGLIGAGPALAADSARCELGGSLGLGVVQGVPVLTWATTRELGVVGFDLFAVDAMGGPGGSLNPALVAASNSPAGASYGMPISARWTDTNARVVVRVWAEDATHTDHLCKIDGGAAIAAKAVPLVAASRETQPRPRNASTAGLPAVESVDFTTIRAGVCHLAWSDLADAFGLPADEIARRADQGLLGLRQQGMPVPSWGDPTTGGHYYFAPRIDTLFFAGNVTQVRFEGAPAMASVAIPSGLGSGRPHATGHAAFERNLQPVPTLPGEAEEDFWVWDPFLGGHPTFGNRSYPFDLAGLASASGLAAAVVDVISASEAQHEFSVVLNGHLLGTESWSGRARRQLRFDVDPAWLVANGNTLQITNSGERISLAYLDRFAVDYPRTLMPVDGPILFDATDGAVLEASGPAGTSVEVWDVTVPTAPVRWERTDPVSDAGVMRFPGTAGHGYVAFLRGAADRPEGSRGFGPDTLGGARPGADYLVITPDTLVDAAGGLARVRSAQGLSTLVVPLPAIRHEFGHGLSTPAALSAFLAHARAHWATPPRYAVIVGDGTYDYRNHSGNTDNLVPPLVTMTAFGRAVSDVLFGDADRDGRTDVAIGRLPVHTAEELALLLGQMADYESRVVASPRALVLADRPDAGGDFIVNAGQVKALLEGTFAIDTIYNDALETSVVHDLVAQDLSAGVSLFNYIGHGGRDRLGPSYFGIGDVAAQDFGPQQPLVVAMTCASGQFGLPGTPCLGEALLLKTGRAPVAVWSPSGFSIDFQAHQLHLLLAEAVTSQPIGTRLGDTLRRCVAAFRDGGGDAVSPAIYNLLGDPGLPLNFGARPVVLTARVVGGELRFQLTGTPGKSYRVEASGRIDGTGWAALRVVTADATGGVGFAEAIAAGVEWQYYRAVMAP